MITIEAVSPSASMADLIVRGYMSDVASRWHGRPVTEDELDQALRDEPYDDLQGVTGELLVAVEGEHPLGCAGVRFLGSAAELTKVFTSPSHRGRGISSQLLRAIEKACLERAIGTLRLDTRAALTEACAMYERNGFVRVGAFNDEPYSDRWYSKTLAASVR
ncbi:MULTISPECIES: GNAT family N-acetyltransferase [unclassified Frondihabitans]|uniref:GNAT family N-acetyltransferase n=1 Tax=unclassified Frondihabitans TaxID=2626248 RepID=UPI000F500C6E|nr:MULTISPECIES: GNAT family N-acetyltransferase [unclassified Frondihabitans]RPE78639.1 acetyltransferase (GNAT) family protein [Frondihabitans sp. PhB153]RPF08920.1 acetyltransferase (GNAT) family protein [Frondihabitans sp. PhB161]